MVGDDSDLDISIGHGGAKADSVAGLSTPHRSKRINLGTPAGYYFKYMNSSRKSDANESIPANDDTEDDTGTISIPGLQIGGVNSKLETSFFSMAGSSTASEESGDLLNKSTLSDTTELTASNFVLVTTSKQNMIHRKKDDLRILVDNKENDQNRKDIVNRVESKSINEKKSVPTDNKRNEKKPLGMNAQSNIGEETVAMLQQRQRASPSLRSRISSSPASLRKFHENLKNSRMKRQQQREEDTQRRLSIDGNDTLDSMNAQLEALTSRTPLKKERLPPPFTQLSQPSMSQESSIDPNSHQSSPAGSNTESTATINMTDLDDILGIQAPTSRRKRSSIVLEVEGSPSSLPGKDETSTLELLSRYKIDKAESSTPSPLTASDLKNNMDYTVEESRASSSDLEPDYSSPGTPSLKLRSSSSNPRKRMTPSKLSPTPQRVVNPQSIFSPASNTRSARKRRKLLEEQVELSASSPGNDVAIGRESSKIGTCLFHEASKSRNDISTDSEVSNVMMDVSTARNRIARSPPKNDDTASLGDIADLFSSKGNSDETSVSDNSTNTSDSMIREDGQQLDGQETASIGDINEIVKLGFPPGQEASSPGTFHEPETPPADADKVNGLESVDSESGETKSSSGEDFSVSRLTASEPKEEDVSIVVEINRKELKHQMHRSPSTPPESNMMCTPPDHRSSERSQKLETPNGSAHSVKVFPKSPIRMTPNNHQKPTPSKLAPTPRRIINPMNPNSPARNTRSASRTANTANQSQPSSVEKRESIEGSSAIPEQANNVENCGVARSSKRRQSVGLSIIEKQMNGSRSPEAFQPRKHPVGILSSKKKGFPRRSVAFGSPEAAEYNIGSPSVSLTPMPKGRARALFTLPAMIANSRHGAYDPSYYGHGENNFAMNESGMNLLIDRMTVQQMNNSPELSPIEKMKTDTDAFEVPSNLKPPPNFHRDRTVELEAGMESLLAKNLNDLNQQNSSNPKLHSSPNESRDNSAELTDAETIASIHSKSQKYTAELMIPIDAQKLDFSVASERPESIELDVGDQEGNTAELEENMFSLFKCTEKSKSDKEVFDKSKNMEMSIESASFASGVSEVGVIQSRLSRSSSKSREVLYSEDMEEGKTVELEGNMLSLLQTTDNNPGEQSYGGDRMEMTVDSKSLLVNDEISEQFTGTLKNISSTARVEEAKTVELEGNMLSLLQITKNNPDERIGGDHKFDITVDSQRFTGNLKHIRVSAGVEEDMAPKLERNMLALLDTADSKPDRDDKMEITVDSTSLLVDDEMSKQFTDTMTNVTNGTIEEEGKTVELEGNMLSLLKTAQNNKSLTGEENIVEGKEMTIGSIAESAAFTASLSIGNLTNTSVSSNINDVETSLVEPDELNAPKEDGTVSEETGMTAASASMVLNDEHGAHDIVLEEVERKSVRRKSLSSNSFTLDCVDLVHHLVDDITTKHKSFVDKSVSFSDTTEFIRTLNTESRSPENTVEECPTVDVSSLTSIVFGGLKPEEMNGDDLSDSFSRLGKSDDAIGRIICEKWGQFIEAVCGEVERRIDQEGTAASSLATLVEEDPIFFSVMQKRFQSSKDGPVINKSLGSLTEAGHTLIEYEWNSWLATVLESFHGPLSDILQVFSNDGSKLDEALQYCKNLQINLSFMNDRITKRARRKSLIRHQTMVNDLQEEVEQIETRLSVLKSEMEELEREEISLLTATSVCHDTLHNLNLYNELKTEAESSQKTYLSLRGLHSWSMGSMSSECLEFCTIGSCPHTHLKVLYKGTRFGKAQTSLSFKINTPGAKANSLYVYHGPIASFLDTSTKRLMNNSKEISTGASIRICDHLQKHTWLTGRLDIVAKEFQLVQRRYNGKLCRNGGESYSFIVEFKSEKSTVVADFTVEPVYPSFPVEVRLDLISGEQDLERIRKALVKKAKPGFGSLPRACDIIQSIVTG